MAKMHELSFSSWAGRTDFNTLDAARRIVGDVLEIDASTAYPTVIHSGTYDLTGSHFGTVFTAFPVNTMGTEAFHGVRLDANNYACFVWSAGGATGDLRARIRTAAVNTSSPSIAYNPTNHKFLRIREAAGTLYWEASPTGEVWTTIYSTAATFALTAIRPFLMGGNWNAVANPGFAGYGQVNVYDYVAPPPPTGPTPAVFHIKQASGSWLTVTMRLLPWAGVPGEMAPPFFQQADWLWNKIPASPVLDAQSDSIATMLADGNHSLELVDYGVNVVWGEQITSDTPRYTVNCTSGWGQPFDGYQIPIPDGTWTPPGSDGHLVIVDEANNLVFNFWQADFSTATKQATYGSVAYLDGDGLEHVGTSTGSKIARLASLIRPEEISRGYINHALFFATDRARVTEFRYPALKTDGLNGPNEPSPYTFPLDQTIAEGTRIQLDPSIDIDALNISAGQKVIAKALQEYGAYCGDNGGSRMGFLTESTSVADIDGRMLNAGFEWDYFNMTGIPWSSMRVLASWNGQATSVPLDATVETSTVRTVPYNEASPYATKPVGTVEGDILLFVYATDYAATGSARLAVPAGFTELSYTSLSATGAKLITGWKRAGATEPDTYAFTKTTDGDGQASMVRISGVDAANSPAVTFGATPSSATSHAIPTTTPTSDRGLHLGIVAKAGSAASTTFTWAEPAGFTEHVDSDASGWVGYTIASRRWDSVDPTGVQTFGLTTSGTASAGMAASITFPSGETTPGGTTPATFLAAAPTNGSTGSKTDEQAILFQATQGAAVSSRYHRWASHLTGDGPYPLVIHLHGDGGYEYDNPTTWTSPQYMDIAKSINGIGIIPNTPDTTSGYRRWWEGYEPTYWLVDLIARLKADYNIDENRIFISGFSGGAVVATTNLVADWPEIFGGGGAMMLGGGGAYTTGAPVPAGLQSQFYMRWHVGDSDEGLNDDGTIAGDGYDAITAAQQGEAKYRADGWNTAIELIAGGIDHLESEPMGPSRLQALIDEFATDFGF